MKTTAIVELWDDKTISIYVPDFDGFNLNGQGKTVEEAHKSLMSAVEDYKEMLTSTGKEIPSSLLDIEFDYKYDIASFFECFKFISVSTFAKYAGINPSLMRQYTSGVTNAGQKQYDKIRVAVERISKELSAATF